MSFVPIKKVPPDRRIMPLSEESLLRLIFFSRDFFLLEAVGLLAPQHGEAMGILLKMGDWL